MILRVSFAYFDKAGVWCDTVQTWAKIPSTGVWTIVAVEHLPVDPASAPTQPTRPA